MVGVTLGIDSKGVRSARGIGDSPKAGVEVKPGVTSMNARGECFMNVLIDLREVCSNVGCHYVFADDPPGSAEEDHAVDLDKRLDVKQVAGIEVYPRRDGMPGDVLKHFNGCGVIQIWTKR